MLEELQRQLDGLECDAKPAEVAEEHRDELVEENEEHKSAFWKMHLDYDVDELMQ